MISILRDIGQNNSEIVNEFFLGFYNSTLTSNEHNWFTIAGELIRYYNLDEFSISDSGKLYISILTDDLSLRKGKLGALLNMPEDLQVFLGEHKNLMK
ncbi:hypothetical protein [Paraflavitalea speifideaquila]|uniref:hypothetical protein n=1 Tax=Paraflavitalea speifideaquila TaxID=3076558 RepID=UPI0028E65652|nr:hypothetical protein [Paraflavitalea speifideiaquila]